MQIRVLTEDDAPAFRTLRMRALQEHREAFAMTPEDFAPLSLDEIAGRLRVEPDQPHSFVLGAFAGETLVGMLGFNRLAALKQRHEAVLWGMYVAAESTGSGFGRALVEAAITQARQQQGLESLLLTVTASNLRAKRLYEALGFQVYGVEPRALRVDGPLSR
jgi:ribosomal protein S18 acetylase RimI-like enzyme